MSDLGLLVEPARPLPEPRQLDPGLSTGDRVFKLAAAAGAASVLGILGLVAVFLFIDAAPALRQAGLVKFLTTFEWQPDSEPARFGIAAVMYGTTLIAVIALLVALPIAIGSALFVNEYAPARLGRPLVALLDLLAAVPSLIYGMWGLYYLQPHLMGTSRWLTDHLGFIPFFHTTRPVFGSSMFIAGIVVGLMVLPIVASVTREVLAQAPRGVCEAALALGGSRWGMIRSVILPFGRSGIVGAAMLGLGRALGETIAIALILSFNFQLHTEILSPGGGSVAGLIANNFGEAGEAQRHALVAAGLALFIITLIVNTGARLIVNKTSKGKME
ncbi:MAG: phosphate ABC transporter permease subunit PstC [Actinomycetota bacterium]|jgi:phosphate transport system permease protein